VVTTPDPALVVPTVDDVKIECLKLAADKQWAALVTCTDKLGSADPAMAKSLRAKAVMENRAETAARKVTEAIAGTRLRIAKVELDKIPADSVYRTEAKAAYDAASAREASVAKTPDRPPLACDADALRDKGKDHLETGMDAAALAALEASMKCRPDPALVPLAVKAACLSRNEAKALYYWPMLSADAGKLVRGICTRNSIVLPEKCDADALRDKGQDHLESGMDAAALAAFEASMKCRPDAGLLRLAFMAACRSKNAAKAKYYFPKLPAATTTGIVQICKRNDIVLP
jgi:hypothetical protein